MANINNATQNLNRTNNRGNNSNNRGNNSNNRGNSRANSTNNTGSSFFSSVSNSFSKAGSMFSKNNVSKVNSRANTNTKGSSSTIFIVIAAICGIIILAVAGYFLYRYMQGGESSELVTKQFIPYIHDASIDKQINSGSIPASSSGNEYNINFWLYVNDYSLRKSEDKCILYRGETPVGKLDNADGTDNINCNPSVWLLKNVNTLRIMVGLETNYAKDECVTGQACQSGAQDVNYFDIEHFPLQKWVAVNITMRSNVIDVFYDGDLKHSFILEGYPVLSDGNMLVCRDGGFNGYISNLKYSNKALPVSTIRAMYKSGPTL